MFSTSTLKSLEFVEIKIVDHEFTLEEHFLVKKALSMYTPGFWVPIGIDIFSPEIQYQKRKSLEETCRLFDSHSSEWAFSSEELEIINQALKHFIQLPLPLYGNLQSISERKIERNQIKHILSYLM
jgi:hypothetical protein